MTKEGASRRRHRFESEFIWSPYATCKSCGRQEKSKEIDAGKFKKEICLGRP